MDQWQFKKSMGLISILSVMFTLLLLGKGYSTEVQTYNGEIRLPIDLLTSNGTLVKSGKFNVQIRLKPEKFSLLFLKGENVIAKVPGYKLSNAENLNNAHQTIPLIGTLLLTSSKSLEEQNIEDEKQDPYIPKFDWRATLRAYRAITFDNSEIILNLQYRNDSGKLSKVNFKMFLRQSLKNISPDKN